MRSFGASWDRPIRSARGFVRLLVVTMLIAGSGPGSILADEVPKRTADGETSPEFSWEMPGRVSIYDLQFGAAIPGKDRQVEFRGNERSFSVDEFKGRLIMMVRFSYKGSKADIPIKFMIKLPGARQYEETVHLTNREGRYSYQFTVHNPANFIGNGSVYLYYGFSMVDVLPFTIMPGT